MKYIFSPSTLVALAVLITGCTDFQSKPISIERNSPQVSVDKPAPETEEAAVAPAARTLSIQNTPGITSIDTGATITKVRTATDNDSTCIIANTYEGTVFRIEYNGTLKWSQPLSGFMNHDLWCADLTGDGRDEILTANADGHIYCLSPDGELIWKFKVNDAPMYSVSVLRHEGTPYVVCGGFDTNLYYISPQGELVKSVPSSHYSNEKPWKWGSHIPPAHNNHTVNFVRPVRQQDGNEVLALIGQIAQNSAGSLYQFRPLQDEPFSSTKMKKHRSIASFTTTDINGDGTEEILMGSTGMKPDSAMLHYVPDEKDPRRLDMLPIRKGVDGFGYRVVQPELIPAGDGYLYYILFGSQTLLVGTDLNYKQAEILQCSYSFNDMWKDSTRQRILLASAQSGGSCVHIIDYTQPGWKESYNSLEPIGKIAAILKHTAHAREQLKHFTKPDHERGPLPVYLMSESLRSKKVNQIAQDITQNYDSPIFLGGKHQPQVEEFDRSFMKSEKYQKIRDRRKKYELSQEEVLKRLIPLYNSKPGISYWGGHGNDPNYYQLSTTQKVLDAADGKKTVLIFPEIQDPTEDFFWLMDYLIYPLAEYSQTRNANLYIRSKYHFWHSDVYLPGWKRLISGEFSDVFVPALEETSAKAMEQSIAARLGLWTSGCVDSWGARCARDNTSFDRSREHSHQMLPNHFLRQMVYNISSGAQYIDNFAVDQEYMSFLWELIAKGALYVPKRSELVSLNPVHLGMKEPDHEFIEEGASAHWTVHFDQQREGDRSMVFSRMNGSWKGAPITNWDFSRFAANVKERRLNFLPPYNNGMVMITPPQNGKFADKNAPRGSMIEHIHPLYKDITQEFITDGHHYYSSDGSETYPANEYYRTVETAIIEGAKKLPLTVAGQVAWVATQTAPKHIRLTLIDSGYINPQTRTATINFGSVKPLKMTDLLSGEEIQLSGNSSTTTEVPLGFFRLINIELESEL